MNYGGILKKAYKTALEHRFLWIFGILAGGYGGAKISNLPQYQIDQTSLDQFSSQLGNFSWPDFWSAHAASIIAFGVLALVIGLAAAVLNIISQAALVGSVNKLALGHKTNFADGFMIGWHSFWRVVGVGLSFSLLVLGAMLLWILPPTIFAVSGIPWISAAWVVLLFFPFMLFVILTAIILPYAYREVILRKIGVFAAIHEGLHLVRDNIGRVLIMYLLLFGISILFGIGLMMVVMIAGAILFGLGYLLYLASSFLALWYGIAIGLALTIGLFALIGAYGSFTSAALTLTYRELKK